MNTRSVGAWTGVMMLGSLGLWSVAEAKVVYVAKTGSDANDGLSWATAKVTVQAGLNAAMAGDEVWVAAGTYIEQITLTAEVALYGGFAGNETDRVQRDWKANDSILDGDAGGTVVTSPSQATSATRIDGFTIRNGKAAAGGGIRCESSSPTITNNTITTNSGSGIHCSQSTPTITNNTITRNSAIEGAGIYCYSPTSMAIAFNTVSDNSSWKGGGIYCSGKGSATITNNSILRNTADQGGGICSLRFPSLAIADNVIAGNSATDGGGIDVGGGFSTVVVVNNTIVSNNASRGGGIRGTAGTSLAIANTVIAFNSSGVGMYSITPSVRSCCTFGNLAYDYSGVTDPTGTNGNISADPRFVLSPSPGVDEQWGTADDDPGDLHLMAGSPCIDAGDNGAVPAGVLTDLDGLVRFFDDPTTPDGGLGTAPIVDMGAYEYIPGDFDHDGDVDGDDMKTFAACVSGPAIPYSGDCAGADFDRDGDVDQSDFGAIQRFFTGSTKR